MREGPSGGRRIMLKKTYKIDVDCANCANKMEMEFEEGAEPEEVMGRVLENCRKVESDCEIFL